MDDLDILLVEDNPGDVRLVERAFEARDLPGTLHEARTGDEALDRLHGRGEFADAPRPDLVLLDLNLPATSGHAVLEEMQADPALRRLPVVVLTSAEAGEELRAAYTNSANACLTKPVDPEAFADTVEALVEFWASAATLPPTGPAAAGGAD